jgi:hypothetical protein
MWPQHLAAVSSRKENVMESNKQPALDGQSEANLRKTLAEIDQITAFTRKALTEAKYYPMVVGASVLAAGVALGKLVM